MALMIRPPRDNFPICIRKLFQMEYKDTKQANVFSLKLEENYTLCGHMVSFKIVLNWLLSWARIGVGLTFRWHSISSANTNCARTVNWKLSNIAVVGWTTGHSMPPLHAVASKCPLPNLSDNFTHWTCYLHKEMTKNPPPSTVTTIHLVTTVVT
jgi:hypothetical protein